MSRDRGPSPRQAEVLRFIASHLAEHGYPPTRRELCAALQTAPSSHQAAHDHLEALQRKGLIRVTPMVSRGIAITAAGREFLRAQPGPVPVSAEGAQ